MEHSHCVSRGIFLRTRNSVGRPRERGRVHSANHPEGVREGQEDQDGIRRAWHAWLVVEHNDLCYAPGVRGRVALLRGGPLWHDNE